MQVVERGWVSPHSHMGGGLLNPTTSLRKGGKGGDNAMGICPSPLVMVGLKSHPWIHPPPFTLHPTLCPWGCRWWRGGSLYATGPQGWGALHPYNVSSQRWEDGDWSPTPPMTVGLKSHCHESTLHLLCPTICPLDGGGAPWQLPTVVDIKSNNLPNELIYDSSTFLGKIHFSSLKLELFFSLNLNV
jgi:hypothetical protein